MKLVEVFFGRFSKHVREVFVAIWEVCLKTSQGFWKLKQPVGIQSQTYTNLLAPVNNQVVFCEGADCINNKRVWVPLTPPFLRRIFFVKIPLVNPLLKSVSCVPPLGGGV